jgi:hypothetical protein
MAAAAAAVAAAGVGQWQVSNQFSSLFRQYDSPWTRLLAAGAGQPINFVKGSAWIGSSVLVCSTLLLGSSSW